MELGVSGLGIQQLWSESSHHLCTNVVQLINVMFASCMKISFGVCRSGERWIKKDRSMQLAEMSD